MGDQLQDKLRGFIKDALKMGCLRGFKYFTMYLRGREELLVTILTTKYCEVFPSPSHIGSDSARIRTGSGTFSPMTDGLPPASPAAADWAMHQENAVFLIGAYARYKSPYVWLRSSHSKLLSFGSSPSDGGKAQDKDFPLKISSTANWKTENIRVWDIVAELVSICVVKPPNNPFQVDREFFKNLTPLEQSLYAGSLASFLRRVYNSNLACSSLVFEDLEYLTKLHFTSLPIATSPQVEPHSKPPRAHTRKPSNSQNLVDMAAADSTHGGSSGFAELQRH